MIRAVGQCACAEDARGNGGAGVAGRSVPRWRDEAGAGIHSEDVVPFCGYSLLLLSMSSAQLLKRRWIAWSCEAVMP